MPPDDQQRGISPRPEQPPPPKAGPAPPRAPVGESTIGHGAAPPITLLAGPAAQAARHAHPALLLAHFAARFPAVVADPVPGLAASLPAVALLQAAYAVLCLPPAAGGTAAGPPARARRRAKGAPGAAAADPAWPGRIFAAVRALALSLVVGAPLLAALLVLFGAPFTTHHAETALGAAHLALLAALPLLHARGLDGRAWREAAQALLPFDEVWGASLGALLGAWLGAVPVPLDWDRPWQRWPVTVVTGGYVGCVLGKYVGEYVLRGKRLENDGQIAFKVEPEGKPWLDKFSSVPSRWRVQD